MNQSDFLEDAAAFASLAGIRVSFAGDDDDSDIGHPSTDCSKEKEAPKILTYMFALVLAHTPA